MKGISRIIMFCFGLLLTINNYNLVNAAEENSKSIDLEPIVVTGSAFTSNYGNSPVDVNIIGNNTLKQPNIQYIEEALNEVTGVDVNTYGGTGATSTVRLRGVYSMQTLVLLDGNPINTPSLGNTDLSQYRIDDTKQIEIVKGPASALYGANALGGVINIIPKDPPRKMTTELYSSLGRFDTQNYGFSNGNTLDKFGYLVTGSFDKTHGYRDNSQCENNHFTGKLKFDISDNSQISLYNSYSHQNKSSPGSTRWPTPTAKQKDNTYHNNLAYRLTWNEGNELSIKTFYNRNQQHYRDPNDPFEGDTYSFIRNYKEGFNIQQTLELTENNMIAFGFDLTRDKTSSINKVTGDSRIGGTARLNNKGIFIEDKLTLLDRLVISLGLRNDYHSTFEEEISPRAALLYNLSDKTKIRASIGKAYRAPSINDLFWNDPWMKGNPNLKPEKSIGYETGIDHVFNEKLSLKTNFFMNKLRELIMWADPDSDWVYNAYNLSKARSFGSESELKINITDFLAIQTTYTYTNATEDGGDYNKKDLIRQANHQIGNSLSYEKNGFSIDINNQYVGRRFNDQPNNQKLKAYTILNLKIAKNINTNTQVYFTINNLTDKEYEIYKYYPAQKRMITTGYKLKF